MHLTVVYIYADVTCVGTGERAFLHLGLDTLEDSGHEAQVDGTADDAVVELEFAAPFEVGDVLCLEVEDNILAVNLEVVGCFLAFYVRADEQMDLTELAGAAGLLLVTVLCGCNLGDGLTVRHLGSVEFDVLLELVVYSPLHIVDVLFAHTGKDGLTEFLGVFHGDGGILCGNPVEGVANLGFVVLVNSLDCAAIFCIGEYHVLDGLYAALGQGDVCLSGLELHGAADVTGADGGDFFLLCTCDCIDGAEALAVAGFRVHEVCTLVEGTAHHAEVGNITEVLLDAGLEDEDGGGCTGIAYNLAAVHGLFLLAFR